jgi:hypothetical protein
MSCAGALCRSIFWTQACPDLTAPSDVRPILREFVFRHEQLFHLLSLARWARA